MDTASCPSAEENNVILSAERTEREIVELLRRATDLVRDIESFRDGEMRRTRSFIDSGMYCMLDGDEWKMSLSLVSSRILGALDALYSCFEGSGIQESAERLSLISGPVHAEARIDENMTLCVRTPHLMNRNVTSRYSSASGRAFPAEQHRFFTEEAGRETGRVCAGLELYREKTLTVMSVYAGDRKLPDSDNLDTKLISDAILRYFPGGDSGTTCSRASACVHSEDIKEGAYFIVSRGFMRAPGTDEVLALLRRFFPADGRTFS